MSFLRKIGKVARTPILIAYAVIKGVHDGYSMDASELDGSIDQRVKAYD